MSLQYTRMNYYPLSCFALTSYSKLTCNLNPNYQYIHCIYWNRFWRSIMIFCTKYFLSFLMQIFYVSNYAKYFINISWSESTFRKYFSRMWPMQITDFIVVSLPVLGLKFIYSEKATKFCEISTNYLSYVVPVKYLVEISKKFVAFTEYMNFIVMFVFLEIWRQ